MRILNLTVLACLLAATAAQAEDLTDKVGIGGSVGTSVVVGSSDLRQGTDGDFNWGFWGRAGLTPNWGLGFSYDTIPFRRSDLRLQPMMANLFYQIEPQSKYNPNVHLGAGLVNINPSDDGGVWGLNGGVGVDRFVTKNISVGVSMDYRWVDAKASDVNENIHLVSLALKVGFWPAKCDKKAEPAPVQEVVAPAPVAVEPAPVAQPEPVAEPAPVQEQPAAQQPAPAVENFTAAHFPFNVTKLSAQDKEIVDAQAKEIAQEGYSSIVVTGHTDNIGSHAVNERISKARAQSVAAELEKAGLSNIEVRGVAYDEPVASNDTKEGRAENRRAEIAVVK